MVSNADTELRTAIATLHEREGLGIDDVLALAQNSIRALTALAAGEANDDKLEAMAGKVSDLKAGIAALQANCLRHQHIPEAGRELAATVEATECAATRIMECAEAILEADVSDPEAYLQTVNAQVTAIFEACAFQDITGQRITRARENLDLIETRVSRFAEAVDGAGSSGPVDDREAPRERRKSDAMLNGPAHEGEGHSQDEIDSLLDS